MLIVKDDYRKMWGVIENAQGELEPVEVMARPIPGGWLVKRGCVRGTVNTEQLSETKEAAEVRIAALKGST